MQFAMADVRVGCAGWSYQDWVGPVYPRRLESSRWLDAYAALFPLVEIDSTFYALPRPETVRGWAERVRRLEKFGFAAKLWQEATHKHLPAGQLEKAEEAVHEFLDRVAGPLEAAGRLEALLVQLPPSFSHPSGPGGQRSLRDLQSLVGSLEPNRRRVAVEFRHPSWFLSPGGPLAPGAEESLRSRAVCAVRVDGLGSRFTTTRTVDWSYFRLHGRRTHIPAEERGLSHAPYDYLYSGEETSELARPIMEAAPEDRRTYVVFNNHYRGQAARNAVDLLGALGLAQPHLQRTGTKPARLEEFGR